jgi:hypothetical protein
MRAALCLCLPLLAACGEFPTAGEPTNRAGYPELLPLSGLIAEVPDDVAPDDAPDPDAVLQARAAALRSRAETLRSATP